MKLLNKKNKETLAIICPVYNEEEVIELFYKTLKKVLQKISLSYKSQIIFVLDKSSDNSFKILKSLCQKDKIVSVILLSKRFGHQTALLAGLDACDSDVVIMMDSDLQHPPSLIPKMLAEYKKGYEVIYTIRTEDKDKSFVREISSKLFYKILNYFSEIKLSPGEADFRLVSKRVYSLFKQNIREQNPFFRGLFFWVGFNRKGVSFSASARAKGESKYNVSRLIKFALLGIISFSKKPLQISIYFGLLISTLSFLFLIYIISLFLFGKYMPSGWTTIAVLISFFGGVQLVFIGIIGEYIGQIYDQVKSRPHYIIERKINIE
jgi:polyisoprenyl-phosphate glycosyltransferase